MISEESDDEPLSVIAAAKKLDPEKFVIKVPETEFIYEPKRKKKRMKRKDSGTKKLPLTFKLSRKLKNQMTPHEVLRPSDVWLYLKDLNPTGPYSCLLCSEWFINRAKMVIHYVLNHKKDFCGICRYFLPDRETWHSHMKFHSPWPCSQCAESFPTETNLRLHFSSIHKLVHCRLCHFRVPDNDQYNTHLFQKHNVSNVSSKDEETFWELEFEGSQKFLCLLCSKSNNLSSTFFNHYMGFHHFTLKCFSKVISGTDPPFSIFGADVSHEFVESLKDQEKIGYVELDRKKIEGDPESDHNIITDSNTLLSILEPDIKEEAVSEPEDSKDEDTEIQIKSKIEVIKSYKGDQDFDVTLMELIVLQKCYFDYISRTLNDINSNIVPENSDIDYEKAKSDIILEVDCSLCSTKHHTVQTFMTHMYRMHSVKSVPIFSCRVCATTFESQNELDNHTTEELGEFDDLWLCQFCDKEYDNRELARRHLTEHLEIMEFDNCFSPHLGFKCKYCPTLFWNETDRETHQVRVHFNMYKEQYYKCEACSDIFSDKIWFIHHYLGKHNEVDTENMYLLKCCICCIVMSSVEEMRNHFGRQHPEARKVFCSLDACQYKPLSHKKSFQLHLRSQHTTLARKDRVANCSMCGREFPSSRACSAHMAQVHGPGKYKCKLCKQLLHSLDERKLHYLIRHPGHHPFECKECGKSFQYKSSLYMHKQEHVPNKQTYTCDYCKKVFVKKDSFKEHVQIHEGPRHACSYCPMRFVQRSNMLRHERRHTGERPYACPHCDRTFADKGACTTHSRTHSKEASYACLYCGQTFVQKSKLTYHIRKHTGENLETCSICSKLFTSACSLREHMKIHTVKKVPVKCPLCDKKYQDERYMLRHLRTTHTHGQFPCPVCRKAVTSAAGLRHHVVTHSKLNIFRCKCCPKSYNVKRTILKHLRKRHGLKGSEINIKDYYKKLEPRECELGLDEEAMMKIFGPPKKVMNDVLIGDFVTFTKTLNLSEKNKKPDEANDDDDDEENEVDEDDENEEDDDNGKGKTKESDEESDVDVEGTEEAGKANDNDDGDDEELEPTDFVSVKIEPLDEDELYKN